MDGLPQNFFVAPSPSAGPSTLVKRDDVLAEIASLIGFKLATVHLANSDVLALPTTPFTLVRGVANSFIVPLMSFWESDFSAGDYTNIQDNGKLGIGVSAD